MKKFTIISLMLVLVASFVFAAGLTPYVKATNAVKAGGYIYKKGEETKKNLTSLIFDGSFTHGVKDASGKVDVYAKIAATYFNTTKAWAKTEDSLRKEVLSTDKTFKYYKPSSKVAGEQLFLFVPSLNAEYYGDNLKANLTATLNTSKTCLDLLWMFQDWYEGAYEVEENLDVALNAKYATALKNSSNIVKGTFDETLNFDDDKVTSTTAASVNFYVPKAGTTAKNTMHKDFDSKTKAYIFRGWADGSFVFGADNGKIESTSISKSATFGLDFFKYTEAGYANLYGKLTAANAASTDETTITSTAGAEYSYEVSKGANAKDVFGVVAAASVVNKVEKKAEKKVTDIDASIDMSIPRLIPVELIDNMSFNLPMDFSVAYAKEFAEVESTELSATVKAYPVYIEFADGAYSLFDKNLKTLTAYVAYGNSATFTGKIVEDVKKNYFNFAAGTSLGLDGATFALDYNFFEKGFEETNNKGEGLVTLSYSVSY